MNPQLLGIKRFAFRILFLVQIKCNYFLSHVITLSFRQNHFPHTTLQESELPLCCQRLPNLKWKRQGKIMALLTWWCLWQVGTFFAILRPWLFSATCPAVIRLIIGSCLWIYCDILGKGLTCCCEIHGTWTGQSHTRTIRVKMSLHLTRLIRIEKMKFVLSCYLLF